jgi:hypothetical protein
MHYIIDGHNLIGKMPDISLKDPDDEVQLILRLRSWTAVSKKRQVTVYFDGGIPGGKNVRLSTPQVRVIFASESKTADTLIINRIKKVKNPPEYTLVTNDQAIIKTANERKMPHLRSEKFALRLGKQWDETPPGPTFSDDDPILSDMEVQEWLNAFGPADENALKNRPKPIPPTRGTKTSEEEEVEPETYKPAANNREDPEMSDQELREWLEIFDQAAKSKPNTANKDTAVSRPRKKRLNRPNPHGLNRQDLEAWQEFTNQDD